MSTVTPEMEKEIQRVVVKEVTNIAAVTRRLLERTIDQTLDAVQQSRNLTVSVANASATSQVQDEHTKSKVKDAEAAARIAELEEKVADLKKAARLRNTGVDKKRITTRKAKRKKQR
jgi:hypothetical protein